jgi:hypothetical protein
MMSGTNVVGAGERRQHLDGSSSAMAETWKGKEAVTERDLRLLAGGG